MAAHRGSGAVRACICVALLAVTATPADAARDVDDTCPDDAALPFADVSDGSVHAASIACVTELGLATGRAADVYAPHMSLRRGQLASFLARLLASGDVELPAAERNWYLDDDHSPHEPAANQLADAGILDTSSATLGIHATVTRAEMARTTAAALDHAGVLPPSGDRDLFSDDDGSDAEVGINRLAEAGVVRGRGAGEFAPEQPLPRDQMASFLLNALDLILDDGAPPEQPPLPPPPPLVASPEGWLLVGGSSEVAGTDGSLTRYTVEIADGLEARQAPADLARFVERTLGDADHGWTSRGTRRLQRIDAPAEADVRILLADPARVDTLCAQAGLRTGGIYSCWNGRFAALNADRWFDGVAHVADQQLYRRYLVNHEVGHALGADHRSCPGQGELAPVMMQLTKSTYGCQPNALPYP